MLRPLSDHRNVSKSPPKSVGWRVFCTESIWKFSLGDMTPGRSDPVRFFPMPLAFAHSTQPQVMSGSFCQGNPLLGNLCAARSVESSRGCRLNCDLGIQPDQRKVPMLAPCEACLRMCSEFSVVCFRVNTASHSGLHTAPLQYGAVQHQLHFFRDKHTEQQNLREQLTNSYVISWATRGELFTELCLASGTWLSHWVRH